MNAKYYFTFKRIAKKKSDMNSFCILYYPFSKSDHVKKSHAHSEIRHGYDVLEIKPKYHLPVLLTLNKNT
jgi:hypothetical protein